MDSISDAQSNCPEIGPIKGYLETGVLPQSDDDARHIILSSDQYIINDNILYHLYQPRVKVSKIKKNSGSITDIERYVKQLVIPRCMRQDIIEAHHDCLLGGGHKGPERTYATIRNRYYWPRLYTEIFDYAKSCDSCQKAKRLPQTPSAPLQWRIYLNVGTWTF